MTSDSSSSTMLVADPNTGSGSANQLRLSNRPLHEFFHRRKRSHSGPQSRFSFTSPTGLDGHNHIHAYPHLQTHVPRISGPALPTYASYANDNTRSRDTPHDFSMTPANVPSAYQLYQMQLGLGPYLARPEEAYSGPRTGAAYIDEGGRRLDSRPSEDGDGWDGDGNGEKDLLPVYDMNGGPPRYSEDVRASGDMAGMRGGIGMGSMGDVGGVERGDANGDTLAGRDANVDSTGTYTASGGTTHTSILTSTPTPTSASTATSPSGTHDERTIPTMRSNSDSASESQSQALQLQSQS
ncbi:hypothetical protein D9758_015639 [Tetrapyrgos nigripes]|uniref:Uncharacterized protein n=1 Tax=Tetrapyrgos nigripes TaxID=182062 RepID=A0A8H5CKP0_9AGAR|nr:hypothetical protein D9758_015639 [Tetrapyrgos nigripes]